MKPKRNMFTQSLLKWYKKNARDLPWRQTRDPYKIWISEVMLQQTTVNTVIPYYERWVKIFPTLKILATAPIQRILKAWQGLGYYQRAKNLHKAAQEICSRYNCQLPNNPVQLKQLPGFGPYTSGAVASIAFDIPVPIVDANVRRVIMRQLALDGYADTSQDAQIENFLRKVIPSRNAGTFNQALMELGALVCRSHEPMCLLCPVQIECIAYRNGTQEIIPKTKKRILEDVHVAIGILQRDNKFLIQKRPDKGLLADLWEFPGGKIEKGETPQKALIRELKEELGADVYNIRHLMNAQHFYTQFRVHLHVFKCDSQSFLANHTKRKWLTLRQLKNYPMPSGSAKIVNRLNKA